MLLLMHKSHISKAFQDMLIKSGLLNFINGFKKKPTKIFLVHGEPEGQKILQEKIINKFNIETEIPSFGDVFKIEAISSRKIGAVVSKNINKYLRLELLERMESLKEELAKTEITVRNTLKQEYEDEKVEAITEKLKQLEQDIIKLTE